ncbi:MAG: ribonuclease HII [Firmicutes bacterium]|nr:ribonuclease HII [Bacillota bacterium]
MFELEEWTVAEIKEWVENKVDLEPGEISALEADSRVSVQRLAVSIRKHQADQQRALSHGKQLYRFRRVLYRQGYQHIAGIDEAGRGPLAGPVVAAAVVFPPEMIPLGLDDSKRLPESKRMELYDDIWDWALAVGIGIVQPQEIDRVNIHVATLAAMHKAALALSPAPDYCLVDGRFAITELPFPQRAIVGGDHRCDVVAAASIIAKVTRDRLLVELDRQYPCYGFATHKGYATRQHLQALSKYGPCPAHRYSYTPVRLAGQSLFAARGEGDEDRTG